MSSPLLKALTYEPDHRGRLRFGLGAGLRADVSKTGKIRVYQRAGRNHEFHSKHVLRKLLDEPERLDALSFAYLRQTTGEDYGFGA